MEDSRIQWSADKEEQAKETDKEKRQVSVECIPHQTVNCVMIGIICVCSVVSLFSIEFTGSNSKSWPNEKDTMSVACI